MTVAYLSGAAFRWPPARVGTWSGKACRRSGSAGKVLHLGRLLLHQIFDHDGKAFWDNPLVYHTKRPNKLECLS